MASVLHHLDIDWSSKDHRRRVSANLVQGAYNREKERHVNYQPGNDENAESLAARLGFYIYGNIVNEEDESFTGTIFKYKKALPNTNPGNTSPPEFVIAFRGTVLDPETIEEDLKSDAKFILHKLHKSPRYERALQAVERIISESSGGPGNVWLAGHSLGSAIALMVGRNLVMEKKVHLETYLFNPPFFAYTTYRPLRTIYWFGRSIMTAVLDKYVNRDKTKEEREEVFNKLKSWSPYLFVNARDLISSGYIWYFRQRKKMSRIGASRIEIRATQNSIISLYGDLKGKDYEPIHLIPSANLTTTEGTISGRNHGIRQWWHDDVSIQNESHLFDKWL